MGCDRHLLFVIVLGLCLGSATLWAAEYYRWVDEDGTVHFTETPPPGMESEKVSVSGKPPAAPVPPAANDPDVPAAPAAPSQAEEQPSRAAQERQQRAEQRARKQAEAEQLAANCKAMQEQYDNFVPNKGIIVQEADGSTRRLTSDERLAKVEEAEQYLQAHCQD